MAKKGLKATPLKVLNPPESKWEPILLMFGGMLLIIFALLVGTTNIRWYVPNESAIPRVDALLIFIPGMLLFLFGFKATSNYSIAEDISSRQAGVGLILCLAIGVGIRLYHMESPFGGWWGDQTFALYNAWSMFVHHKIPLINEWGWNPCFPYCVEIMVFKFFPNLSGSETLKMTSAVIETFSFVTFYFLGKEVGGKRTGLIMVTIAVISREMIIKDFEYFGIASIYFIIGLTLLVFFRLIHKPNFSRFIQWGAITALGLYVCNDYRAWVPFILIGVSSWVIFHREERKLGIWSYGLASGNSGLDDLVF